MRKVKLNVLVCLVTIFWLFNSAGLAHSKAVGVQAKSSSVDALFKGNAAMEILSYIPTEVNEKNKFPVLKPVSQTDKKRYKKELRKKIKKLLKKGKRRKRQIFS